MTRKRNDDNTASSLVSNIKIKHIKIKESDAEIFNNIITGNTSAEKFSNLISKITVNQDVNALNSSVNQDVNALNSSVNALNSSVNQDVNALNSSVNQDVNALNSSVNALNSSVNQDVNALNSSVNALNSSVNQVNTSVNGIPSSVNGNTIISKPLKFKIIKSPERKDFIIKKRKELDDIMCELKDDEHIYTDNESVWACPKCKEALPWNQIAFEQFPLRFNNGQCIPIDLWCHAECLSDSQPNCRGI